MNGVFACSVELERHAIPPTRCFCHQPSPGHVFYNATGHGRVEVIRLPPPPTRFWPAHRIACFETVVELSEKKCIAVNEHSRLVMHCLILGQI